jgi:hypothetical protein
VIVNGREAVILLSSMRNDPAAALRGFAKASSPRSVIRRFKD